MDDEELRRPFEGWLAKRWADVEDLRVGELRSPKSGFSARSFFVPVRFRREGREHEDQVVLLEGGDLVDHARAKSRLKRGGDARRVVLDEGAIGASGNTPADSDRGLDVERLDDALSRLGALDERKARLVELRFFCGLDERDAADLVGVSRATASREWRMARSWLARELERMENQA